ncbi:hypothetical protein [Nocardioides sp. SYSU D00038]|uniref:hypothetical protein n=1 Tax=Nocardioides sp. SYSU D00038 TaxID=2812554 RepID=UPI0019677149|nr:hypothetical protein [Nocardioides sp. SYSU D00038]
MERRPGPPRPTGVRPLRRLLALPLLIAATPVALATTTAPASALSCVGPKMVLADATFAYAGEIVERDGDDIRVAVDEVWKGTRVPDELWLRLELVEWFGATELSPGTRRVFAPSSGPHGEPTVNPCSTWLADQSDVVSRRPTTVTEPVATSAPPAAIPEPLPVDEGLPAVPLAAGTGGAVGLMLIVAGGLARRGRARQA